MTFAKIMANLAKLWAKYGGVFLKGTAYTVQLSLVTVFFGLLCGAVLAYMKLNKFKIWKVRPLNVLASIYVEILRGTPLLLQLYFFCFLLPSMLPGMAISRVQGVLVALTLNSAAYVAEIIRAGIAAVDKGQVEAARSLGLSSGQTMVHIVLPQAVKNILPALGNELVMMIKETSLASTFFVGELMTQANIVGGASFLQIESLIIAGVLYLILTTTISQAVGLLEKRLKASD